jgi:excisionase family DNA binding protein
MALNTDLPGTTATEPYISLSEVAQRLGFSVWWVREQVKRNGLPVWRAGGRYRFRWSEVEEWFAYASHRKRDGLGE